MHVRVLWRPARGQRGPWTTGSLRSERFGCLRPLNACLASPFAPSPAVLPVQRESLLPAGARRGDRARFVACRTGPLTAVDALASPLPRAAFEEIVAAPCRSLFPLLEQYFCVGCSPDQVCSRSERGDATASSLPLRHAAPHPVTLPRTGAAGDQQHRHHPRVPGFRRQVCAVPEDAACVAHLSPAHFAAASLVAATASGSAACRSLATAGRAWVRARAA